MAVVFPARSAFAAPPSRQVEAIGGRQTAAGEALVRYRQRDVKGAVADPDIDSDERVGTGGWHLVRSHGRSTDALLRAMKARADIETAEPNYRVALSGAPNDLVPSLWGLQNTGQTLDNGDVATAGADIGAVQAWDVTTGSRQAVVATIDTGIMAAHQDLAANLWSAPHDFTVAIGGQSIACAAGSHGFNAITRTCDPADDNGHGTHVAGSIGAAGNNGAGVVGVNWTASIMAVKFLDASGNGFVSDAINAIDFAIQAKQAFASSNGANVRVLNNSWDGGDYSQALADEIQRAADADMLFVAAAGNHSSDNGTVSTYPANYGLSNVVSVAASDYHDQLASYSDYSGTAVHIAAPGSLIYSTFISTTDPAASSYKTMSGTSMATAYVSGAAALVLSHCTYSTGALRDALLTTSTSLSSLSGKVQSGRRLNAAAAVASCDPSTAQPSDIVVYASDVPASNRHGSWTLQADATAAGGSKLATADAGVANTSAPLAAPADYFDVPFSAPSGVAYHLWLRLRALNDSKYNDSVYVQFSDALLNGSPAYAMNSASGLTINLENCSGCGVAGWGWQDGAYWLARAAVVTFASSGPHTLRVQVREDGVAVDQIVLSPETYLSASPGQVTNDGTIVQKPDSSTTTPGTATSPSPYGGTAAAVPGTIQAEDFDTGGEGAGYHDTTPGNAGGAYRQTDVDLEPASGGGYDVGWTAAGEWLRYSITVASAGTYAAQFRVASAGPGGTFHLEVNGANVSGALTVPNTGGWQNWQTVAANVTLAAGPQVARLVMDAAPSGAVGNFDSFTLTAASSPAGGTTVPAVISAADYDAGGEGVSYHDTTAGNAGGAYRQDDVDIEASSDGGYDVGWIAAGEWLNYTVNVPAAGSYTVTLRVASPAGGGALHVGFNKSSNVWTQVGIPATGGWQAWTTVTIPVTLGAGQQQLTILCDNPGYNLGKITIQ